MPQIPAPTRPQLSEQIIEQMVKQKGQEIDLRFREIALQEKNLDHQAKYADKVLVAQADDLKDQRAHDGRKSKWKIVAGLIALVVVLTFLALCILKGFGTIALEIVKAIVYLGVGGVGGYAARGRPQGQPENKQDDPA
jgi:uncharacterized membrane protein